MDKSEFWKLIGEPASGKGVELVGLRKRLEGLSDESLCSFRDHLQDRIDELLDLNARKALESNPQIPKPISDDGYEYLIVGVIAHGRAAFEAALRDTSELERGGWAENEELLYLAEDVLEGRAPHEDRSDLGVGTISTVATVIDQAYPSPVTRLEEDFPVDSFGWIDIEVQDLSRPAIEIFTYPDGEYAIYPEVEDDRVRFAFQDAAANARDELHQSIDFRRIPGLFLCVSVEVGSRDFAPEMRLVCPRNGPFDLRPGVAVGVDRRGIPSTDTLRLERFAASKVTAALAKYFEGHERELSFISSLSDR